MQVTLNPKILTLYPEPKVVFKARSFSSAAMKPQLDKPLFSLTFNFNLRPYIKALPKPRGAPAS